MIYLNKESQSYLVLIHHATVAFGDGGNEDPGGHFCGKCVAKRRQTHGKLRAGRQSLR